MAVALPPSGETGEDRYALLAEINVTPMVDVMLVLFVIFMVTAPLLTVRVPLDLPKSRATTLTEPKKPVIISLNRDAESAGATGTDEDEGKQHAHGGFHRKFP
jgi:biopolymer transport protein ExbD